MERRSPPCGTGPSSSIAAAYQGPEKGKPLSALVKAMQDGDAYVNLHTAGHKAGEIRGQIK
jgi:hypothetical protein